MIGCLRNISTSFWNTELPSNDRCKSFVQIRQPRFLIILFFITVKFVSFGISHGIYFNVADKIRKCAGRLAKDSCNCVQRQRNYMYFKVLNDKKCIL
jgi:hypothetical protein